MKKAFIFALFSVLSLVGVIALHNNNLNSLLSAVEKSEEVMEAHSNINKDFPSATVMRNGSEQYCLGGVEGRECSFDASKPLSYWIRNYLNPNAGSTRDSLLINKFEIEQVSIFPFFRKLSTARNLYLNHVDAWESYLKNRATCNNYDACFRETNEITPTFKIANKAFIESIWIFDSKNNKERISEIFEE